MKRFSTSKRVSKSFYSWLNYLTNVIHLGRHWILFWLSRQQDSVFHNITNDLWCCAVRKSNLISSPLLPEANFEFANTEIPAAKWLLVKITPLLRMLRSALTFQLWPPTFLSTGLQWEVLCFKTRIFKNVKAIDSSWFSCFWKTELFIKKSSCYNNS